MRTGEFFIQPTLLAGFVGLMVCLVTLHLASFAQTRRRIFGIFILFDSAITTLAFSPHSSVQGEASPWTLGASLLVLPFFICYVKKETIPRWLIRTVVGCEISLLILFGLSLSGPWTVLETLWGLDLTVLSLTTVLLGLLSFLPWITSKWGALSRRHHFLFVALLPILAAFFSLIEFQLSGGESLPFQWPLTLLALSIHVILLSVGTWGSSSLPQKEPSSGRHHSPATTRRQLEELIDSRMAQLQKLDEQLRDEMRKRKEIQEELARSQHSILQASKATAIGTMAAGVVHEITSPLTVIGSMLRRVEEQLNSPQPNPEKIMESVDRSRKSIRRVFSVLENLRTISRGGTDEPFQSLTVTDLVNFTLDLCREQFRSRGIPLLVDVPEERWVILCQRARMTQLLFNLLTNALEASSNRPSPWVRLKVTATGPHEIEFSIMDSGPGIPKKIRHQLFDPFFTTKGVGLGMGLGLTLSATVAGQHKGSLYLDESSENTRFVLRIPTA